MDWKQAIERNRAGLAGVVAGLIAMVRAAQTISPLEGESGAHQTLSRLRRLAILRILRPAESALRRLIVIVATMMIRKGQSKQAETAKAALPDFSSFTRSETLPAFNLIDPRRRFGAAGQFTGFARAVPRISVPGWFDPVRPTRPDDQAEAAAFLRRIRKLQYALSTLPKQARRLNRLMAKRSKAEPGPVSVGPIRPGHPPGHRKRPRHEADDILRECHLLALECGLMPP